MCLGGTTRAFVKPTLESLQPTEPVRVEAQPVVTNVGIPIKHLTLDKVVGEFLPRNISDKRLNGGLR